MRPIANPMNGGGSPEQIQFAEIPKPPVHPAGWKCGECQHWRHGDKRRVAQVAGAGQAPVSELVRAGIKLPDAKCIATVSLCTFNPQWNASTDDHWCAQFDPMRELLHEKRPGGGSGPDA